MRLLTRGGPLPFIGLVLVALIAGGQSLHDGSEIRIGTDDRLMVFVAMQSGAVALYLFAVTHVVGRAARTRDLWIVLAVAVLMRAIPLASPMFLSSDLFRYIWDGRVQLAGINPYIYVPGDETLAAMRDTAIFSHVNRAMYAHTIYPPAAQAAFAAIAWIGQTPLVMRSAMVAFEAVTVAALLLTLRRLRRPLTWVLIYAWNPLAVWEFAGNGHVDAFSIALVALALLAATVRWPAWAGAALAAATLVKFLPLALAPALWRRWDWRMPLAAIATVIALYACYAGAGRAVLGFLPAYTEEEGMGAGTGYWALAGLGRIMTLPANAGVLYLAAVALLLLALAVALIVFRPEPALGAALIVVAVMTTLSPHYPWYFVWACVPAAISPQRSAIFIGSAALLLYLDPFHERFFWPALVYVPTIGLLALDLRAQFRRSRVGSIRFAMASAQPLSFGER